MPANGRWDLIRRLKFKRLNNSIEPIPSRYSNDHATDQSTSTSFMKFVCLVLCSQEHATCAAISAWRKHLITYGNVQMLTCFKNSIRCPIKKTYDEEQWSCLPELQFLLLFQNTNNPYPTAFPYRNGMVLHFYQQQESNTTKTVHKVINKGLKTYV